MYEEKEREEENALLLNKDPYNRLQSIITYMHIALSRSSAS